jgi:hypothetical protein
MKIVMGVLICVLILLPMCGDLSDDSPKEVVIRLFGAMDRDDRAAIVYILDLPSMMGLENDDYALQTDSPRTFYNPEDILDDLTGEGLTKSRWFALQRVIGRMEIHGDSALVEVSFINKEKGIQYYNKFGLCRKNNGWKIYSFRTMKEDKK